MHNNLVGHLLKENRTLNKEVTIAAASNSSFFTAYDPSQAGTSVDDMATAYVPDGGAAMAIAPPRAHHEVAERQANKPRHGSKRCWMIAILLIVIGVILVGVIVSVMMFKDHKPTKTPYCPDLYAQYGIVVSCTA